MCSHQNNKIGSKTLESNHNENEHRRKEIKGKPEEKKIVHSHMMYIEAKGKQNARRKKKLTGVQWEKEKWGLHFSLETKIFLYFNEKAEFQPQNSYGSRQGAK